MERGKYKRVPGKKRNISEEAREAFRKNMAKAREKAMQVRMGNGITYVETEKSRVAKVKNAGTACAVRTARTVLRKMPLGATEGTEIKVSRYRALTVVDPVPVKVPGIERWEQKFKQSGRFVMDGKEHVFSGDCRIYWDYEPTMENIMEKPMFEEDQEGE